MLYVFFWAIPRRLTPGNYPEENIQHTEHGESLKSRIFQPLLYIFFHMRRSPAETGP
jgi:hypothetical protein